MNFLGHYYFDRQLQNPLFNTGLSLPDLFTTFNRKWRIRHINAADAPTIKVRFLTEGCCTHLESDRKFHQSSFFNTQGKMLKELLKKYQFDKLPFRPFFLSHILLELLVDRILMKKFPDLLPLYYTDLEKVTQQQMAALQDFLGFSNIDGFWKFFKRFREHQFLFNYQNNKDFTTSINHIFSRVKQPVIQGAYYTVFSQLLSEAEMRLTPEVLNIQHL